MLRYDRQTKPGLITLYDIRPGNGAGLFLQPRSPHGVPMHGKRPTVHMGTYELWMWGTLTLCTHLLQIHTPLFIIKNTAPLWIVHVKLVQDITTNTRCCSRSQSHQRHVWKLVSQDTQSLVVRSKVMPPLHTRAYSNNSAIFISDSEQWQTVHIFTFSALTLTAGYQEGNNSL